MVFPRFAKFPAVGDAAKLDQLVGYEIEQNVPFPIDEIVSDCQFLGTTPEGEKAAIIVAAKLEVVRAVTESALSAGLKPLVVDVSPMAVCNALRYSNPKLGGCTVVLDIGAKTTNLIILEDEKIYNRSIPVAGNTITKEIAQAFGCSLAEAEQLKIERGYVSLGGVTEDADEVSDQVSKIIRNVLTRLHVEVSRSINFYRSQQGGSAPSQLFLTGGSVRLPQLDQFFMESLQVSVGFLNPFAGVSVGSRVNMAALENDAFTLAESVGLALRQTDLAAININLMPPEILEQARAIRRIPFLVVGALAVWGALGAAWYAETHLKEIAEEQYEIVKQDRTRLEGENKKLEKAQKDVAQECAKCDEFQQLLRERTLAIRRLSAARDSLKRIDDGLWITKWEPYEQKDEKEVAPPKVGAYITFRGWRDVVEKAEAAWSAKNAGKTSTVNEIVVESLKGLPDLFDKDEVKVDDKDGYKELGDCLREYKIKVGFAAAPSISQKAAGGKRKAAQK